jgi:hypothetical protein
MGREMKKWRVIFVLMSCLLIWVNDWSKVNCNYQIHLRNSNPDWESLSTDERVAIKKRDEKNLPFSFFHTHSDYFWMYEKNLSFWTTMKLTIPIFFTCCFALLEWLMLPLCFSILSIRRLWIGYYYLALMTLVFLLYLISDLASSDVIFAIARKVWMILQSPSLFVLFFIYNLFKHDQDPEGDRTIS